MSFTDLIKDNVLPTLIIIISLILIYVGYVELNHYGISQLLALFLIITGILSVIYCSFLIYSNLVDFQQS